MKRKDFLVGSEALTIAFSKCQRSNDNESLTLDKWNFENDCLIHPPITRNQNVQTTTPDLVHNDDEQEEEEVVVDHEQVTVSQTTLSYTEWHFSVVYSDTWQVPVLYFQVQQSDGQPLWRQDVLGLLSLDDEKSNDDSWHFLSQEEHPVTGVPSFFLHPCQTSALLNILKTHNKVSTQSLESSSASVILSWMSIVLPAVGLPFPPGVYSQVQDFLDLDNSSK